jgi:glyoxylate/hydroxypyruvate reductase
MNITFCCARTDPSPWLQALRLALPEANITLWEPGHPLARYAIVWAPPQQFFDEQTALKGIFNIGAGVDALMQLHLPQGVPVTRLRDAGMGFEMAEYVCHAVAEYFRDFAGLRVAQQRAEWAPRPPLSRQDFAVGILGFGVLGQHVARALLGFGYPVNAWSHKPQQHAGVRHFAGAGALADCLQASRVLVCLLPLTPHTKGILNRENLGQLQKGAYLINVARGAHLLTDDLLALLANGHLKGATLDVFEQEPLPADHPFWHHPAITVTPHMSAPTLLQPSVDQIATKLRLLEAGQPLPGLVVADRGY